MASGRVKSISSMFATINLILLQTADNRSAKNAYLSCRKEENDFILSGLKLIAFLLPGSFLRWDIGIPKVGINCRALHSKTPLRSHWRARFNGERRHRIRA